MPLSPGSMTIGLPYGGEKAEDSVPGHAIKDLGGRGEIRRSDVGV